MTRENELLRKILRGENEYWEELIGMYYEDIYRYCIYHAPDRNLAQDAVQETFLKVIRYFPNYRDRGKFRAFLYKVASNVCTDQWRKCREEEIPEDTVYLETGYARSEDDIRFLERGPGSARGASGDCLFEICAGAYDAGDCKGVKYTDAHRAVEASKSAWNLKM